MWTDILWIGLMVLFFGLAFVLWLVGVIVSFITNNPWKILATISAVFVALGLIKDKKKREKVIDVCNLTKEKTVDLCIETKDKVANLTK